MLLKLLRKKHLSKDKWFSVIEEENKGITKEVEKAIDNNGTVVARKKKGIIRALIFFEAVNDNKKILKHTKNVFIKDVDKKEEEKIVKTIKEDINTLVSMDHYEEITYDDTKVEQKKTKIGQSVISVGLLCVVIGAAFALLFDDLIYLGFGFIIGMISGTTMNEVKKSKVKKKNKKEK